jgi:hypothetical protein
MHEHEDAVREALGMARLPATDEDVAAIADAYPGFRQMAARIIALADADGGHSDLVFRLDRRLP